MTRGLTRRSRRRAVSVLAALLNVTGGLALAGSAVAAPSATSVLTASATTVANGGLPIGLGFRVPAIVVSPWTVGGNV